MSTRENENDDDDDDNRSDIVGRIGLPGACSTVHQFTASNQATMESGTQVWSYVESSEDPWILSEIIERTPDYVALKHLIGATAGRPFVRKVKPASPDDDDGGGGGSAGYEGVEIANTPLSKAEIAEGADNDMISLQHLHEPAILHAVSERYFRGEIYTWTGPILIAVNPFRRLPLYTREILESYRKEGLLRSQISDSGNRESSLGPHVFAVSDRSYRQMMSEQRKSQSILISGESGAGKTETTKIVMRYLTKLGAPPPPSAEGGTVAAGGGGQLAGDDGEKKLSVMERVMQSNPILEAFGNAKTLRNDNSSRFGKFIELGFDLSGILRGARVQTYLLEKVRIGYHAPGERNYHIFYQLLRGAEEWHARCRFRDGTAGGGPDMLAEHFHLTGQGGAPRLREFTDKQGWDLTLKSMRSMGWSEEKIDHVLKVVAGILHLGQVKFEPISSNGQEIAQVADDETLADAAALLGVDLDKLVTALTVRIMVTRGDEIRIDLAPDKAADARDALAKTVYGAMFLWVVREVNNCIKWENDSDIRSSAGVLDIFGFESFAVNSFEQLCINFTNEALQQQFNKFIFKLEQEEYERENISWEFIEFPDNQDCLDTIQARPKGILAMLDDECKMGQRGNDRNWAKRLNDTYLPNRNQMVSDNTRYSATKMQQAKGIFCVRHFAGNVAYTAETNFLEKNRDEIPLTAKSLFEQDSSDLIKEIYAVQKEQSQDKPSTSQRKGQPTKQKTVSQQFKSQLNSLIEMIETTDPHYIRCLKPNDEAKSNRTNRRRLTEQLRYGGVLEAVRVARAGFPSRMDHASFFKRYRMLLPSVSSRILPWSIGDKEPRTLCGKFLEALLKEKDKPTYLKAGCTSSHANKIRMAQRQPEPMVFPKSDVQLGLSKVFMRKGPHDRLESHRAFRQSISIVLIQSWVRCIQHERGYCIMREAALTLERWGRGCLGRARWWRLRTAQARLLIINNFRMQIIRRKYKRARRGTVCLQAQYRGRAIRKFNAAELAQQEKENVKKLENDSNVHTKNIKPHSGIKNRTMTRKQVSGGSSSSDTVVSAERCVDAMVVGHTFSSDAWNQHQQHVARLEEQLELLAEEKKLLVREQDQAALAAAAASKKRRCKSRGMYAFLTILLSIVAMLGGLLGSKNFNGSHKTVDASYLRGSGNIGSEATPSSLPTPAPSFGSSSVSPSSAEDSSAEDIFCPPNTMRFVLNFQQLGSLPKKVTWVIFDRCSLHTYYNCTECYNDFPSNFAASFAGCLPTVNNSNSGGVEYVFDIDSADAGVGDNNGGSPPSYQYDMIYDGEMVASSNGPTDELKSTHYFGDENACTDSPSVSLQPSRSPSEAPSLAPTTTLYPSFSPTTTPQPSAAAIRKCHQWFQGTKCDPVCRYYGASCCCCVKENGDLTPPTDTCKL